MRTPMPSPRNTNFAKLYLNTKPAGAYDAALPDDQAAALILFLQERLSEADFTEACRIGKLDAGITMDDENGGPERFKGTPQPGGGKFGEDSAMSATLARIRKNSARIKVNP
jgi:hypothetical protein